MGRASAPARFTSLRGRVPLPERCSCAPPGAEERGRHRDPRGCWELGRVLRAASGVPVQGGRRGCSRAPFSGALLTLFVGRRPLLPSAFYSPVYRRDDARVVFHSGSPPKVLTLDSEFEPWMCSPAFSDELVREMLLWIGSVEAKRRSWRTLAVWLRIVDCLV